MNKSKIIAHFGANFYEKLLLDLHKYTELWRLSDFEQVDYYSINCIFTCVSERHGPCVLKLGEPSDETAHEYGVLREYEGTRFCRVYEADVPNGVLLLERIVPGTRLRDVPELDRRIELFREVYGSFHKAPADSSLYPTYMECVSKEAKEMQERGGFEALTAHMREAERLCRSLCGRYTGEVLLHGDLHHDNILLGNDGRYRIIDPKGVVGDGVFDIPRFILNELDGVTDDDFRGKYLRVTQGLSAGLGVPEADIRQLTYVEMCLCESWTSENGQPREEQVQFARRMMDEIL